MGEKSATFKPLNPEMRCFATEPSASNELDPSGARVEGTALATRRFLYRNAVSREKKCKKPPRVIGVFANNLHPDHHHSNHPTQKSTFRSTLIARYFAQLSKDLQQKPSAESGLLTLYSMPPVKLKIGARQGHDASVGAGKLSARASGFCLLRHWWFPV